MESGRDQWRNFLCTRRIFWPVNSKLLSLTALANVQRFDATHTVRHVFFFAPHADIHEPTPGNFPGANTATIVFTSGEKIKHPVTAGPGSISISAHFHVSPKKTKSKKGCFLERRVRRKDMINNTSGLWSADLCCPDFNKSVEKKQTQTVKTTAVGFVVNICT